MLSKKCFEYAELELIEIEHCLHSISDDWSSAKIVKAFKRIAIYNIDKVLKYYDEILTPYDISQLKQLRQNVKKFNCNRQDGDCFKDKFPYGYEDMFNTKWLFKRLYGGEDSADGETK